MSIVNLGKAAAKLGFRGGTQLPPQVAQQITQQAANIAQQASKQAVPALSRFLQQLARSIRF